jgi:hypothetical protein
MVYTSHKEVFALAAKIAKELRTKNPKLTVPESTKLAWKDSRIVAARAEVAAHNNKTGKAEGGSTSHRPRSKATGSKPSTRKRKPTTGSRKVRKTKS